MNVFGQTSSHPGCMQPAESPLKLGEKYAVLVLIGQLIQFGGPILNTKTQNFWLGTILRDLWDLVPGTGSRYATTNYDGETAHAILSIFRIKITTGSQNLGGDDTSCHYRYRKTVLIGHSSNVHNRRSHLTPCRQWPSLSYPLIPQQSLQPSEGSESAISSFYRPFSSWYCQTSSCPCCGNRRRPCYRTWSCSC